MLSSLLPIYQLQPEPISNYRIDRRPRCDPLINGWDVASNVGRPLLYCLPGVPRFAACTYTIYQSFKISNDIEFYTHLLLRRSQTKNPL